MGHCPGGVDRIIFLNALASFKTPAKFAIVNISV